MFEWLSHIYMRMMANYEILLGNPTHCDTVQLLRLFTLTLLIIFMIKLLVHLTVFYKLKRRYTRYTAATHPELMRMLQDLARRVKLRRIPALYRFANVRPLIFSIGSIRPGIFIAPRLLHTLADREVEAALIHELIHIKRLDGLLIWFLEIFFVAIPLLVIQIFALSFVLSIENSVYAISGTLAGVAVFKFFLWKRILFLRELSCDDLSVRAIGEPLIVASSMVNVWRLARTLPQYPWQRGLNYAQTLISNTMNMEYRVQRLIHYKEPRIKFIVGKIMRLTGLMLGVMLVVSMLHFYQRHHNHDHFITFQNCQFHLNCMENQDSNPGKMVTDSQPKADWQFTEVMNKYVQGMNDANFSVFSDIFSRSIEEKIQTRKMHYLYKTLMKRYGKIWKVDNPRVITGNVATFTTHFQRGLVDIQITLNDKGKIVGLTYLPTLSDPCELAVK